MKKSLMLTILVLVGLVISVSAYAETVYAPTHDKDGNPRCDPEVFDPTLCDCEPGESCPIGGFIDIGAYEVQEGATGCEIGTTQPCTLTEGVCSGSVETCLDDGTGTGYWPGCTSVDYGPNYEVTESLCSDGLDNDCDALTDYPNDPDCPLPPGCIQSATNSNWQNNPITKQEQVFSVSFESTPNGDNMDSIVGFGSVSEIGHDISTWSDNAIKLLYYTDGRLYASNGDIVNPDIGLTYHSEEIINYQAGETYTISLSIDPVSRTYNAAVLMQDGTSKQLANSYSFNTHQTGGQVNSIDTYTIWSNSLNEPGDTHTLCNFELITCTDNDRDGYSLEPEASGCDPISIPFFNGYDDCRDDLPLVNPNAIESLSQADTCGDGLDNNCDGFTDLLDPNCQSEAGECVDTDGDGYGVCPDCGIANGCQYEGNDCDDNNANINEDCADGSGRTKDRIREEFSPGKNIFEWLRSILF